MINEKEALVGLLWVCLIMTTGMAHAQTVKVEATHAIIFHEDFQDSSLPRWNKSPAVRSTAATLSRAKGPDGIPAVSLETRTPVPATLSVALPVQRVAGKAVLLQVWRKAENVRTGAKPYFNAKSMLSWKARSAATAEYSSTIYSDFSGTSDWERHMYVMQIPPDVEWARVTIGMQECTGKASWAGLTVSVDPRFPSQNSLERFLARQQRDLFAGVDKEALTIKRLNGGVIQVFSDHTYVPRKYWNAAVRNTLLQSTERPNDNLAQRLDGGFDASLAVSLTSRAGKLENGLMELSGDALNDRVYEIVSLRERARQLVRSDVMAKEVYVKADDASEIPVSLLVFGNNINAQNLTAPYDFQRRGFPEAFLQRVRPMGITFLRYPGGCNADIFNWKDSVGPLTERKEILNYHTGTGRGIPEFGVDEYLRFCEQEGMVPVITTAFLRSRPEDIDLQTHPQAGKLKYVAPYLKSAPERIRLAADWVEYCNGSVNTLQGRRRAKNGHPEPYHVKYWEIGNESYGPDRVGSCTAEEYARAFPGYVAAMKARDPSIQIAMNGCGSRPEWNDVLLETAGKYADLFQIHIYRTPQVANYTRLEGRPRDVARCMRMADDIPAGLQELEGQMMRHLGHTLPVIVTEFGMGNARNREFMTSVTSAVLVADMLRTLIESPLILGANKWCLYSGYWFSQVEGPSLRRPDAPYYIRPEQIMHELYARCRARMRLPVNNDDNDTVKAVVFKQARTYGVVLISREPVDWQSVTLDLPGARAGKGTCIVVTAGHPFVGNEADRNLVRKLEFEFDFTPGTPMTLPSNAVVGLMVPRTPH